ncbi:MAG: DNA polymerase IV [Coprobacillaceae bacterium]
MQVVFHIDLNAFFASAETSIHPELAGKPLVISRSSKRSIVTTASYEARKYGIHSAMPLFKALELCKDLVVRPGNYELYRRLSNEFFGIVATYSDKLEVASIDECFVDVTDVVKKRQIHPKDLAKEIQDDVYQKMHLQTSIGVAPNKFLAKMASDMKKPMGITIITRSNLKEKLWPLEIKDMFGIGKKTQPKLIDAGIKIIGDIANYDNYPKLREIYGKNALLLYRKANGIDNSKVNNSRNQLKSVGNSTTLDKDTTEEEELKEVLKHLSKQVSSRAMKRDLISNSISITIKFTRFESISRQTIINKYVNDYETILSTAKMLFDANYNGKPVRLLGVSLNNVIEKSQHKEQISLFDTIDNEEDIEPKSDINSLINKINDELHIEGVKKASEMIPKKEIQKKYIEEDE